MSNRRQILSTVPAAFAAGMVGTSAARAAQAKATAAAHNRKPNVIEPGVRDAFPDVKLTDQFGREHRLFDDLIENNIVLLNFMTIGDEESLPVTKKLSQLANLLGDKLTNGSIRMISITRSPRIDSPSRLRKFAAAHNAPAKWLFLTGMQQDSDDMSLRMYRMNHSRHAGTRRTDIVFYGNGSAGVWGGFPVDIDTSDMAERITWVMPQAKKQGKAQRAGPRKYDAADRRNHNRQV